MYRNKILILNDGSLQVSDSTNQLLQKIYSLPDEYNINSPILKDLVLRNKYFQMTNDVYIDKLDEGFEDWLVEFKNESVYGMLYDCLAGIVLVIPSDNKDQTAIDISVKKLEDIKDFLESKGFNNKFFVLYRDNSFESLSSSHNDLQADDDEDDTCNFMHFIIELCSNPDEFKNVLDIHDWLSHKPNKEIYQLHNNVLENRNSSEKHLDFTMLLQKLEMEKNNYNSIEDESEAEDYLKQVIEEMSDLILQ